MKYIDHFIINLNLYEEYHSIYIKLICFMLVFNYEFNYNYK